MIRRLFDFATAPLVAILSPGPVLDRIASRLTVAPRRLAEEAGMAAGLDALGGELVRLRARDGIRLTGRWLASEPGGGGDVAWTPDPHEAVLLLHGWSGSITPDLLELAPFLRRTASVLGLDFRGHGGSDDAPATFGMTEIEDVAGALAWLGERGITRVALVGSSMGAITAIAATVVLGDGRLPSADLEPDAPAATISAPRPRIVAVVADAAPPELAVVIGSRLGTPFARRVAERALGRLAARLGGDPRATQPIAVVGLLEDVPLLLVHGAADRTVPLRDAKRLARAAPAGTRHLVIDGADHGRAHATDPDRYEHEVADVLRTAFTATRS